MTNPKTAVINLMNGVAPERRAEIAALWDRYKPDVDLSVDAKNTTMMASKDHIVFDQKTIDVYWLIGFAGWKAIETYSALIMLAVAAGQPIGAAIKADNALGEFERSFKERLQAAQTLINTDTLDGVEWPPDLPHPTANREDMTNDQDRAAYDIVQVATGFILLHEFKHVMLDRDGERPKDRREEELACDVWARSFVMEKIGEYVASSGQPYEKVLRLRSMGLAVAALILYEITPSWDHGGNKDYFSLATRLRAILQGTNLPPNDSFWLLAAGLLIGMLRKTRLPIDAGSMSARDLADYLMERMDPEAMHEAP
ncbi:MAG: peptidase U49, Lit peptidase [Proteobacteria bacterium]|nr:peptidase U49, Lit peptidase [Pseudomonadota bacterium]